MKILTQFIGIGNIHTFLCPNVLNVLSVSLFVKTFNIYLQLTRFTHLGQLPISQSTSDSDFILPHWAEPAEVFWPRYFPLDYTLVNILGVLISERWYWERALWHLSNVWPQKLIDESILVTNGVISDICLILFFYLMDGKLYLFTN